MTPEQIDLLPCPFCGELLVQPYLRNPEVFRNPESQGCFAGRAIIHPENYAAWNRRASPVNTALAEDAARAHDLTIEVERLRDALDVFAKAANIKLCGKWRDHDIIGGTDIGFYITFGHLRRAADTMSTTTPLDTHAATAAVLSARDSIPE